VGSKKKVPTQKNIKVAKFQIDHRCGCKSCVSALVFDLEQFLCFFWFLRVCVMVHTNQSPLPYLYLTQIPLPFVLLFSIPQGWGHVVLAILFAACAAASFSKFFGRIISSYPRSI